VNRKLILSGTALVAVTALTVSGCNGSKHPQSTGQKLENQQQAKDTTSLVQNQPVPGFNYSQVRQNLKEVETAEANGVQTTSFFFNQGVQDPIMTCPSIGAPIAHTAQLTNPSQVVHDNYKSSGSVLTTEQMDPTGIYTGDSDGTYVICVDAQGNAYANYWEGFVQTVFGNAVWDKTTHQVSLVGKPSFDFSEGKK
jgi:hypothetical protein